MCLKDLLKENYLRKFILLKQFWINWLARLIYEKYGLKYFLSDLKTTMKHQKRIIEKNGKLRTTNHYVKLFSWKYIKDFFISTMNLSWVTIFLTFFVIVFGSWFGFALAYGLIFWMHGDFHGEHDKCVTNMHDFTSCFLFSGLLFWSYSNTQDN